MELGDKVKIKRNASLEYISSGEERTAKYLRGTEVLSYGYCCGTSCILHNARKYSFEEDDLELVKANTKEYKVTGSRWDDTEYFSTKADAEQYVKFNVEYAGEERSTYKITKPLVPAPIKMTQLVISAHSLTLHANRKEALEYVENLGTGDCEICYLTERLTIKK